MSAFTIRPPGPDPASADRSIPFCSASRRASGLAFHPLAAIGARLLGRGGLGLSRRRVGRLRDLLVLGRIGAIAFDVRLRRRGRRLARAGLTAARAHRSRAAAAARSGRRILAFGSQDRNHGADLHLVGAFRHQDLRDRAFVDRFELHGRLVRLDLGEQVPEEIVSPSLTSHLASVPSSMVGERAGILSSIGIAGRSSWPDGARVQKPVGRCGSSPEPSTADEPRLRPRRF
jgi:hypothetical protein